MNKLIIVCLIALSGCAAQPARVDVVSVPTVQPCVKEIPPKPSRLTAKPRSVSRELWVIWMYKDIEALQSAVDQLTTDLEACR